MLKMESTKKFFMSPCLSSRKIKREYIFLP